MVWRDELQVYACIEKDCNRSIVDGAVLIRVSLPNEAFQGKCMDHIDAEVLWKFKNTLTEN